MSFFSVCKDAFAQAFFPTFRIIPGQIIQIMLQVPTENIR